jgi:hypothetical protein
MGEAISPVSLEERRAEALRQSAPLLELVASGAAPHYAFILDRSPRSKQVIEAMRNIPELRARTESPAFRLWEELGTPYLVMWGTWGYTGGLTIPCFHLEAMLEEALPTVMERVIEKGGLCSFLPCVEDSISGLVQARIAELQPTGGPEGVAQ